MKFSLSFFNKKFLVIAFNTTVILLFFVRPTMVLPYVMIVPLGIPYESHLHLLTSIFFTEKAIIELGLGGNYT